MPLDIGNDSNGCFARWGQQGKKYYYQCGNKDSADIAKKHAINQAIAIGEADKLTKDTKHWVDNYKDMINTLRGNGNKD